MVLDNAASTTDATADFSYEEEGNAAADGFRPNTLTVNLPPNNVTLDLESLPLYRSLGIDSSQRHMITSNIMRRCEQATKLLNRPLRKEEVEAFAVNADHSQRIWRYGRIMTALTTVGFIVLGTRNTWRRAQTKADGKALPRFSPRMMLRPMALSPIIAIAGFTFVTSYASTVNAVRDLRDPRLTDYSRAVREAMQRGRTPVQDVSGTTQPETFEQRRQRENMQGMIRQSRAKAQSSANVDDASPTGGPLMQEWQDFAPDQVDNQAPTKQTISPRRTAASQREDRSVAGSGSDFYTFDSDSTSPTATQSQATDQTSGSTWERIRSQAAQTKSGKRGTD